MDSQGDDMKTTGRTKSLRSPVSRREFLVDTCHAFFQAAYLPTGLAAGTALITSGGCVPQALPAGIPDLVWGRRGLSEGRFMKPRAMVIDPEDRIFTVDKTGRIQVFDINGDYLTGWRTPMIAQGKPTGLGIANDGTLLVADTHYFRVLFYSSSGDLDESRTIGGEHGDEPGMFHFVTDVVQDQRGHFLIGQYGQIDRIQEFSPEGEFLRMWGSQGSELGQFSRPQALLVDDEGLLWVADACNHRMQVFDLQNTEPELVMHWGEPGTQPGQLQYPYGVDFDVDGTLLIAEFGNHRVQRFSRTGESLEILGSVGTTPGLFNSPWALGIDSKHNLHVLDTMNHRMQRFPLGEIS